MPHRLSGLLLFPLLVGVWAFVAEILPPQSRYLFPAPLAVARALWESLGVLWQGTVASMMILIPGYILAVLAAVLFGIPVGATTWARHFFAPLMRVAAPVPPTVYVPYAIALLPTFRASAIFVVFIGAFWPVFLGAVSGAATVPERHRDNARVLGFGRWEYWRRVAFHAALPAIFNGMGVGMAMAFILLTVAELFGANVGLGHFVQYYADFADYPRMVAGIIYTGAVTFSAMTLLAQLQKRMLFWNI
ncbi:MAG: ABC transporter permease subunit [Planctomycetota bacterium]|jgi:NitT/TauT family transport system permease protein|nr:ABC transporter permease subunit [Planctomycetota bacterium]